MSEEEKKQAIEEVVWAMRANLVTAKNFLPSENLTLNTIYKKGEFDDNDGNPTYKSMGVEDIILFIEERFGIPTKRLRVVAKPAGEEEIVLCDWTYNYENAYKLYENLKNTLEFCAIYIEEEE